MSKRLKPVHHKSEAILRWGRETLGSSIYVFRKSLREA